MEEVEQRMGPIAVLVNNAANDQRQAVDEVSEEDWDRTMALNLKHQFFAAQIARRSMRELGGGAIVNFSSTAWMLGVHGLSVYATAKAAVIGLTNTLAREFGARQYPRQRHRPRRRDHRAAAPPLDERGTHRGLSHASMHQPNLGRRRCRAARAVSFL